MKQQIARLSPHQNAKVFAVLMALSSLVLLLPIFLVSRTIAPSQGPPILMLLIMPLIYLIFGYVMVAIGCAFYNFMYRYIGGIEFDSTSASAE